MRFPSKEMYSKGVEHHNRFLRIQMRDFLFHLEGKAAHKRKERRTEIKRQKLEGAYLKREYVLRNRKILIK